MAALARTPVLPKTTPVGSLSALSRRSRRRRWACAAPRSGWPFSSSTSRKMTWLWLSPGPRMALMRSTTAASTWIRHWHRSRCIGHRAAPLGASRRWRHRLHRKRDASDPGDLIPADGNCMARRSRRRGPPRCQIGRLRPAETSSRVCERLQLNDRFRKFLSMSGQVGSLAGARVVSHERSRPADLPRRHGPWSRPKSAPKPPFHCERKVGFTALRHEDRSDLWPFY